MSVPPLPPNNRIAIQPTCSSGISLPPWGQTTLKTYCDEINKVFGSRGDRYRELLGCLNKAIQPDLTPDDFDQLGHNLLIIFQKVPRDILARECVQDLAIKLFFHAGSSSINLLKNLCLHLNHAVGTRTVIYEKILGLMVFAIKQRDSFEELESIGRCFSLVVHNMPSDIQNKNNLKKLTSYLEKQLNDLLKSHCCLINEKIDNCIAAYKSIFDAIEEALQLQEIAKELDRLNRNLTIVTEHMKSRGLKVQDFGTQIDRIKQHLHLTSHFVPLKERLFQVRRSSEVLSIQNEMKKVKGGLPKKVESKWEEEIDKCIAFSEKKLFTRLFVEDQNRSVNSQNAVSSTSAGDLELTRHPNRTIYPILSIDGGGIRGIIPATVLAKIEEFTRQPIANLFRLVGGTSTGGILALGLTKPDPNGSGLPEYRAQDLLNLYTENHGQIFRRNQNYREKTSGLEFKEKIRETIFNPRYITPDLFQNRFGTSYLSSALTDVVITANTTDAIFSKGSSASINFLTGFLSGVSIFLTGEPTPIWSHDSIPRMVHLFTNKGLKRLSYSLEDLEKRYGYKWRHSYPSNFSRGKEYWIESETTDDFLMANIAKITSAAPGYFPPQQCNGKLFMDGGVLQNNPAIPCALEALDRGHRRESLFMLSLGTGVEPFDAPGADLGSLATSLWFQTTQPHSREDNAIEDMLVHGASYRFQYHFGNRAPGLDHTDTETIAGLQQSGMELVEENLDQIREICRVLDPESI